VRGAAKLQQGKIDGESLHLSKKTPEQMGYQNRSAKRTKKGGAQEGTVRRKSYVCSRAVDQRAKGGTRKVIVPMVKRSGLG